MTVRSGVFAVAVIVLSSVLADCGSTKTVTVNAPPSTTKSITPKTVKQTPTPSTRTCSAGVTVNAHASCPFAESILAAYAKDKSEEQNNVVTLGVESPDTHQSYAVACLTNAPKRIVCHATDAEVTLSYDAVIKARARNESSTAPTTATCAGGIVVSLATCAFASDVAAAYIKHEGNKVPSEELTVDGQRVTCALDTASERGTVTCIDKAGSSLMFVVTTNGPGPPESQEVESPARQVVCNRLYREWQEAYKTGEGSDTAQQEYSKLGCR